MARVSYVREADYPPDLVFQVLCDVEQYPQFVPGVLKLARKNERASAGQRQFEAEAFVRNRWFSGTIRVNVEADADKRTVRVRHKFGPFETLSGVIRVEPVGAQAAKVHCMMDAASKAPIISDLLNTKMMVAVDAYAAVFVDRVAALA
jgi:coenzyme Q-binding protein COQ10